MEICVRTWTETKAAEVLQAEIEADLVSYQKAEGLRTRPEASAKGARKARYRTLARPHNNDEEYLSPHNVLLYLSYC